MESFEKRQRERRKREKQTEKQARRRRRAEQHRSKSQTAPTSPHGDEPLAADAPAARLSPKEARP
jgi:hypothetical protein